MKSFYGQEAFDPVYKGPALRIFRSYTQIRDMCSIYGPNRVKLAESNVMRPKKKRQEEATTQ